MVERTKLEVETIGFCANRQKRHQILAERRRFTGRSYLDECSGQSDKSLKWSESGIRPQYNLNDSQNQGQNYTETRDTEEIYKKNECTES